MNAKIRHAVIPTVLVTMLATLVPAEAATAAPQERVIVRFDGAPALGGARDAGLARRQALRQAHGSFLRRLAADKITARLRGDYTSAFNGVALQVRRDQVAALSRVPGVLSVRPDAAVHAAVDEDVSVVRAPQAWAGKDSQGRANDGTGEVIGIIDSGVDYTHPDLGGGFGPGHKVVAGHDFVNGDDDPMDDNGHGTHVAGIAAGDPATPDGRSGVAPKATLTAYKVLDGNGNGLESTVLEGLDAAVDVGNPHRADVVNLSLTGPGDDADPLVLGAEQAVRSGVVVVAAAGNHGPGESTVGSPAVAPDVLAVGASISGIDVPSVSVTSPVRHAVPSTRVATSANPPSGGEELELVDAGNGDDADYAGKDVAGKAVLIADPGIFREDEVLAVAERHGPRAVLMYTPNFIGQAPRPQFAAAGDGGFDLVAVTINGSDADDLKGMLAKGPVKVSVTGKDATDQVAALSSNGPVPGSYRLKPDLVAPGIEIRSTWPGGRYERESGTSMAAPHVAGAAALVRQRHPDWSPEQVTAALTGTAHLLPGYGPVTEGAGRLDAAAAVDAPVLASPARANFGLADLRGDKLSATTSITLSNTGTRQVDLALSTQRSGQGATVTAQPAAATLAPGATVTVRLTLSGARPATGTDLSGWLRVAVDGAPRLTVPYLLAVRPLELHATPDPTESGSTVLITSEPQLAAAPSVTATDPHGRTFTTTATVDHPGWWRAAIPANAAGLYRVRASAPATTGGVLTGETGFEEMSPDHGNAPTGWQPVGPVGDGGPLAVTPERPGRMYVMPSTNRHAGLFRTDDGGTTWHELRTLPVGDGTNVAVVADPVRPDTVYLAVNRSFDDPTFEGTVLASRDAGRTWTRLPFPNISVNDLTIDPTGRMLVATTDHDPLVSTDQGRTWRSLTVPASVHTARVIGQDLYAATSDGVYAIRDVFTQPGPATLVYRPDGLNQNVADVVGNGRAIVARTQSSLVVSRDGGGTWSTAFTSPGDDPFIESIDVADGDFYASGRNHLWTASSDGTAWTSMPVPATGVTNSRVAGWRGTLMVSAFRIGVYRTDDQGRSYARVGVDGIVAQGLAVTKDTAGHDQLVVATDHDDYRGPVPTSTKITPAVREWGRSGLESQFGHNIVQIAASPADPRVVFRTVRDALSRFEIERSTDGGATWSAVVNYHASGAPNALLVDPVDPNQVYVAFQAGFGPGVLVSRDGGQSWHQIDLPGPMTALAADPNDAQRIWFGGPAGLFRSDDGGQTLTRLQATPVSALAIDRAGRLLIGGNALYTSADGGRTLRQGAYSDLRMRVTGLLVTPGGTEYAATGSFDDPSGLLVGGRGVLRSTDGGRTWQNVSQHLANLDVTGLAQSPDGQWIFAATVGGGVYRAAADH